MSSDGQDNRRDGMMQRLRRFLRPREGGLRRDIENVIETHEAETKEGQTGNETTSMLRKLISFSDLRVEDVMVPRVDIVAVEDTASMRDMLNTFIEANHSRIPVFVETLDDVKGMVHVKDLMRWLAQHGMKKKSKGKPASGAFSVPVSDLSLTVKASGLARDVLFVPPSMPARDLLLRMQSSRIHIAMVIDEYGGTDGLVSIEDLLEEIIGDIEDEHDDEDEKLIKRLDEKTYVADARAPIAMIDKLLGVDLFPDEQEDEAETLGGLIFEMAGRVPPRGAVIRHASGLEFEILQSDPRRVKRIRIRVLPQNERPVAEQTGENSS